MERVQRRATKLIKGLEDIGYEEIFTSTELIFSGEETLERGYDFNLQIPYW